VAVYSARNDDIDHPFASIEEFVRREKKLDRNLLEIVGYEIDHLVSIELWLKLQGKVRILQEAAQKQLGEPMTYAAAEKLMERVREKDIVAIGTGFVTDADETCETDGPIGAAALARSIRIAFNATPVIFTEHGNLGIVSAACRGIGLNVKRSPDEAGKARFGVCVADFPMKNDEANKEAIKILDQYQPSAIISIERPGKNIKGVYHSFRGFDISGTSAKFDYMFELGNERGILTIGIGDVGNELGMGNIRETVLQHVPYAKKCLCPCGSGTACAVSSKVPVIAAVSNWGAYGIAAVLATMKERFEVLHDSLLERRAIRECVDAGAIDGETGRCEPAVDGSSDELHAAITNLLSKVIRSGVSLKRKEHLIPTL
jgi:hypothetical protein